MLIIAAGHLWRGNSAARLRWAPRADHLNVYLSNYSLILKTNICTPFWLGEFLTLETVHCGARACCACALTINASYSGVECTCTIVRSVHCTDEYLIYC